MRILLVEDEASVLLALSLLLEQEGYSVVTASNGSEALQVLAHEHADLVILDLWMPVMNGWEFLQRLRERENPLRDLPVIALSADVNAARHDLPVQIFLSKPMDIERLLDSVRYFLQAA
ncbi:MAG: response regulator [Gemmatimonadetes bacterium]|nr:response regulator [Gemmatimonadota bacterium]